LNISVQAANLSHCRIESKKIDSVARIESNQNFFCLNSNALLVAMQQLIDMSWPTAANPLQWRAVANGMNRQTDARQLHRSCSTYYAGSAKWLRKKLSAYSCVPRMTQNSLDRLHTEHVSTWSAMSHSPVPFLRGWFSSDLLQCGTRAIAYGRLPGCGQIPETLHRIQPYKEFQNNSKITRN